MLCVFDRELLYSNVGQIVYWLHVNNNGEVNIEDVVRRLEEVDSLELTNEMRLVLPTVVHEWVEHFERKKNEYVPKSKNVSWWDDRTYNIWPDE